MSSFSPSLLPLVSVALALPACSVSSVRVNEDHCANQDGDAYCGRLFPDKPFCTKGVDECALGDRYGCVADVAAECREPCGELGGDGCEGMSDSSSGTTTGSSSDTDMEGSTGTTGSTTGPECMGDEDCMDPVAPFCGAMGECVSCDGADDPDGACAELDPTTPICDAGACVPCTAEQVGACEGMTPVCGEDNECVACTEHDQCPDSACHLDGELRGACFDAAEVTMIENAGELAAALGGLAAEERAVFILTGSDYAGVTEEITNNAEIAIVASGTATVSGNSGFAVIGVSGNAIAYFDGVVLGPNGTGPGINCSGASVWLDDARVSGNAQLGLDVSGGCATHLRRTLVRANSAGGITVDGATSSLDVENSVIGDNVGPAAGPGIRITGSSIDLTYSTVVSNGTFAAPINVECLSGASGSITNSIITGPNGDSVDTCDALTWETNALDLGTLGASNQDVGPYDSAWFVEPGTGDYHLTTTGENALMDIAMWQDGDPMTDVDGDPIPTDVASFPGYDQP